MQVDLYTRNHWGLDAPRVSECELSDIRFNVGVIGVSYKNADLTLRSELAKIGARCFGSSSIKDSVVFLSTCNRVEIYFYAPNLMEMYLYLLNLLRSEMSRSIDQKFYSHFGTECFSHLVQVAAGLESANLFETEIKGQVKLAYERAAQRGVLSKEIHFLFQKSLALAKKLRGHFHLEREFGSLGEAVLKAGHSFFEYFEKTRVLFIGASEVNQRLIRIFKTKKFRDIVVCNRSHQYGNIFAQELGIQAIDWTQFSSWPEFDWIIFGTKSHDYLLDADAVVLEETARKLLLDLSVPANVDPKVGLDPRIRLLNIDEINQELRPHMPLQQLMLEAIGWAHRASREYTVRYLSKGLCAAAI